MTTSLAAKTQCNPVIQRVSFDWLRLIDTFKASPLVSLLSFRWRTRGGFVHGADGREGQSRWCQSSDASKGKHMHTDWNLALFSVLLVDSVWLRASVYFWPLGSWFQTVNMIHKILSHILIIKNTITGYCSMRWIFTNNNEIFTFLSVLYQLAHIC